MAFKSSFSSLSSLAVKRSVLATGAALTLLGGIAGVAGAQQPTPTATPRATPPAQGTPGAGQAQAQQRLDQYLTTLAGKLGVSVDSLRQAMTETRTQLGLPDRGHGHFGGRGGPGGPGGPGRDGVPGMRGLGAGLTVAAQAINITVDQLRQELPGKSLADVARAHNVDPARVTTALKNDANTRIDQAVTAGRFTAEQATQAKQRSSEMVDQLMTRQTPAAGQQRQPGQPGQPGGPGRPGRAADLVPGATNA